MNRLELLEQINLLAVDKNKKEIQKIEHELIEQNSEISKFFHNEWIQSENKIEGEQWHQFVRLATEFKQIEHMFKRVRDLLFKHNESMQGYFRVNFQTGVSELPDRSTELFQLFNLVGEYFRIYKKIENRMNSDRYKVASRGIISGKINWDSTIKKMKTDFPLYFETDDWKKKFNTPENILLIWIAIWLSNQINILLKTEFRDPLDHTQIKNLMDFSDNCKKIIKHFPFYNVVDDALQISSYDLEDKEVKLLEFKTTMRYREGLIENRAYDDLLLWMKKIRSFNFPNLRKRDGTANFLLEAIENVDTMYEIWIFFELLDHFSKYGNVQLVLKAEPQYFQFELGYQNLELFYEKTFEEKSKFAWAQKIKPDFTLFADNEIIGVFDAKNYKNRMTSEDSPIIKVLAYMTNLDTGYGAILWPRDDENEYVYPRNNNESTKHHFNLKVASYKFDPYKPENIRTLEITLNKIYQEIKNRIKPFAKCPSCNKIAVSNEEIERLFGFRNMAGTSRPQSWCRDCRKTSSIDVHAEIA